MRQIGRVEEGTISGPVAIEGANMGQKSGPEKEPAEQVIKQIVRASGDPDETAKDP